MVRLAWLSCCVGLIFGGIAAAQDGEVTFDPDSYPQPGMLRIASVPVRVQPLREYRFASPSNGLLVLVTDHSEGMLEEGEQIGIIDGERLEIERSLLQLTRRRFEQLAAIEWKLDQQGRRIQMEERLDRLHRQQAIFSRIKDEPEIMALFVSEGEVGELEENETWDGRLSEIETEIKLVSGILAIPQGEIERDYLETEELKLRQRELEFQRREEISILRMPFSGLFKLNLPLNHESNEYRVESNQVIGVAQDVSVLQVLVPVRFSEWREMPLSRLQLQFGGGLLRRMLEAHFVTTREMIVQGRPELFFEFQFSQADSSRGRSYIGGTVSARMDLKLPEGARVIPKLDFARAYPEAVRRLGWTQAVKESLPAVRQAYIGESEIAVVLQ